MGTAGKSARDGGLVGGATAIAVALLTYYGVDAALATVIAPAAGFVASIAYRIVRRRWPWLLEADPPGGAD